MAQPKGAGHTAALWPVWRWTQAGTWEEYSARAGAGSQGTGSVRSAVSQRGMALLFSATAWRKEGPDVTDLLSHCRGSLGREIPTHPQPVGRHSSPESRVPSQAPIQIRPSEFPIWVATLFRHFLFGHPPSRGVPRVPSPESRVPSPESRVPSRGIP